MKLTDILTAFLLSNLFVWGLPASPVYAQTGGPDNFGYGYADSNELTCRTTYHDISNSGTPLNLTEDGEATVTAPFSITLYGTTSTDVRIGNNGGIVIGATSGNIFANNAELPSTAGALADGPSILPFWDDLDNQTGNVYTHTLGSAPYRRFIVQWHQRPHYNGDAPPDTASFQVVFYEGNSRIDFVYSDVDFSNAGWDYGASATIGINRDGNNALQYSFNEASILTGGTPVSAVCFDNSPGSISLEVTVGPDRRIPGDPGSGQGCLSEENYTIRSGEAVTFCYEVTNTSLTTTYTNQDLVSSEFGRILSGFPFELRPGASVWLNEWKEDIVSSFTETATWTAHNSSVAHDSSDSASVVVLEPICPAGQIGLQKNFYDFESNNGGGTATNDWQWGVVSSDYPAGLGGAHSGEKAWATVLEGPYSNLGGHSLLSFEIDLTEISGPVGIFWYQVLHANNSTHDFAKITANGDEVYSSYRLPDESGWTLHYADLSSYTGELVTLSFDFFATTVVNDIGWYVDDLLVEYCPQAATSSILKTLYYPIISGAAKSRIMKNR